VPFEDSYSASQRDREGRKDSKTRGKAVCSEVALQPAPVKRERRRCFNMLSTSPPKTAKAFNFVGKSQTKKRATVGGRVDSRDGGLQGLRKGGEGVYLETFVDTIAELEEGWAKP
jgi:hypothetical protein